MLSYLIHQESPISNHSSSHPPSRSSLSPCRIRSSPSSYHVILAFVSLSALIPSNLVSQHFIHRSSYSRTLFNPLLDFSSYILNSRSTFAFPILRCQLSSLNSLQRRCPVSTSSISHSSLIPSLVSSRLRLNSSLCQVTSVLDFLLFSFVRFSFLYRRYRRSAEPQLKVRSYTYPRFILAQFNLVVILSVRTS